MTEEWLVKLREMQIELMAQFEDERRKTERFTTTCLCPKFCFFHTVIR